ncbi:restriction endonuclease subunit S [Desulfosudis oleivorans]|uniref:Restriction modification system DNA specificity domain n=1 Tax=Desulfosudis oleivorans (strain DSM 6200 / JCM 39069 / Hxd3) TaxID=96561 RepID=A8ZS41_DESOH|nr:restriction endonuclease subunit S [Desulfosudis oleivorans]ABW66059.1 restriction modification system DNA specificity domain [Desulfosudis oleivorans Hxd3]
MKSKENSQFSTRHSPSVPPGYKQTEVGVIPEDWEVKPLAFVVKYTNGKAHEQSITDSGNFVVVNSKFISTEGIIRKFAQMRFCPAEKGDVLMVMSDVPNGRAIAKCFWVDCEDTYTVNQRICVLNPCGIDGKLLYYKLDRNPFYLTFDDGAKQTNLRKEDVLSCPLSIPNTEAEQRAIAAALSDVDALLDGLDRLIAKKRDLKQAAMQQLLTGQTRLPGFKGEWEIKRLGDVLMVRHGKSQRGISVSDGKYPILASGGEIGRTNTCIYDKPSVLIGRKGTIDSPQYVDSPFWTVDTLFFTEISTEANAKFIFSKFSIIPWRTYNEASGVPSLNAKTIENIEIFLPSPTEQTAIAQVLSDMDAEIAALEQRRNKTRDIKQAMMQELLTGKTRLV